MINCPNCGGLNSEGSIVCGACGVSLVNNNFTNEMPNQENNQIQNIGSAENNFQQVIPNAQPMMQQDINQNDMQAANAINDNALINAYIGNNADTLRNGTFSWCTLFFEWLYMWYRKMYKLLAIWFLIFAGLSVGQRVIKHIILANSSNIITASSSLKVINVMFKIISLIVVLVIAFNFKELYLKHVKEKILVIKNENPNSTEEELCMICAKKGGTSKVAFVVIIVLLVLIVLSQILMAVPIISRYIHSVN